jgi:hypothetical protein
MERILLSRETQRQKRLKASNEQGRGQPDVKKRRQHWGVKTNPKRVRFAQSRPPNVSEHYTRSASHGGPSALKKRMTRGSARLKTTAFRVRDAQLDQVPGKLV